MKDFYWSEDEPGKKSKDEPKVATDRIPSFVEVVQNRIYFYSAVNMERILKLNKNIREVGINLQREATIQKREPANIYLHIHSYGGSVFAGLAGMDEIIKSVVPVHTIIDGCCASAATFLSISGKKRYINNHAYMLIHQIQSIMWGKYEEFKDEMENLDKIMKMIKDIYVEYTNIPMGKLEGILKHDLWFTADECKKYNLIDEIII